MLNCDFNKVIKKEALAKLFSCEFCEIFKNIFFTKHLCAPASGARGYEKSFRMVMTKSLIDS